MNCQKKIKNPKLLYRDNRDFFPPDEIDTTTTTEIETYCDQSMINQILEVAKIAMDTTFAKYGPKNEY